MHIERRAALISWTLQFIVAAILFQTLFFKFTGAEESRHIFRTLGLEPAGRIGAGITELIAVILLLTPRTAVYGALLAVAVISGAIASHLIKLGIVVQNDGGLLFGLAVAALCGSVTVAVIRRRQMPLLGAFFARHPSAPLIAPR